MNDKKLNGEKLWESAYSFLNHPRMGPYMHGAGMVERTTGVTHFWLVRGPCTRSVVKELQGQLGQAYSFARPEQSRRATPPEPPKTKDRPNEGLFAMLLVVGLVGMAVGSVLWA